MRILKELTKDAKIININKAEIFGVIYNWKSPSFKGDKFFGWIPEEKPTKETLKESQRPVLETEADLQDNFGLEWVDHVDELPKNLT